MKCNDLYFTVVLFEHGSLYMPTVWPLPFTFSLKPTSYCVFIATNTQGPLGHEFSFQCLALAELTIFVVPELFMLYESAKYLLHLQMCAQITGQTRHVCWRQTWHRCQRFTIPEVVVGITSARLCCYRCGMLFSCAHNVTRICGQIFSRYPSGLPA